MTEILQNVDHRKVGAADVEAGLTERERQRIFRLGVWGQLGHQQAAKKCNNL